MTQNVRQAYTDLQRDAQQQRTQRLISAQQQLTQQAISAQQQRTQRTVSALSAATALSTAQANTLLQALGTGTDRQTALAQIAIGVLDQDRQWNQFLADYGLRRDQVLAMLDQGNLSQLQGLINSFLQFVSLSRGGYVGSTENPKE